MAVNRLCNLNKCQTPEEDIADRLRIPRTRNFIIDQQRVLIDTFSRLRRGSFAKVIRATYHGAGVRAKFIHADLIGEESIHWSRFQQECRLASDLRHPNVVNFYGVVMNGPQLPMLIMEELACTLYDFIDGPENYVLKLHDRQSIDTKADSEKSVSKSTDAKANSESVNKSTDAKADSECASKSTDAKADSESASKSTDAKADSESASMQLDDDKMRAQDDHNDKSTPKPESKAKHRIEECLKNTIALGIAQGLDYLHTKKPFPIVHRDLSSSNILLGMFADKVIAKIADFGQAKEIKAADDWSSYNPGNAYYLPPEVLLDQEAYAFATATGGNPQAQQEHDADTESVATPDMHKKLYQQKPLASTDEEMPTAKVIAAAVDLVPEAKKEQSQILDTVQAHKQACIHTSAASPSSNSRLNEGEIQSNISVDTIPWAKDPDLVWNEQLQKNVPDLALKPNPPLKISIDMYMYGVLLIELISEHHPPQQDKESWHMLHVKSLKALHNPDHILYQIAKYCIKEDPSERPSAANVVENITLPTVPHTLEPKILVDALHV